jgi:uncharacterized protein (TIGR03083 family)
MTDHSPSPGTIAQSTLHLRTTGPCHLDPLHLVDVFAEQRQRFAAVLQGFGAADWTAPTRCADWSAHDVVRHICDATVFANAAGADDGTFDLTAGFDPRISPRLWLTASAGESPAATLSRLVAATDGLLARARGRLARGITFDVRLPYGPMDWTVLLLHLFWDSWIHERDVLLARGAQHPTADDAIRYAVAYGVFISAAVGAAFGNPVQATMRLGGDGGGIFELDSRGGVALTVSRRHIPGPRATDVADALAGRADPAAVLDGLPAGTRAGLSHLAEFFNTHVQQSPPANPANPATH